MTFIESVNNVGNNYGKFRAQIDSVVNKYRYYKSRDVEIINLLRVDYRKLFPNKAFPAELRSGPQK